MYVGDVPGQGLDWAVVFAGSFVMYWFIWIAILLVGDGESGSIYHEECFERLPVINDLMVFPEGDVPNPEGMGTCVVFSGVCVFSNT